MTLIKRRAFLEAGFSMAAYATVGNLLRSFPGFAQSSETYTVERRVVWINMSGGWDILETVDPKPASTAGIDVIYDWSQANVLAGSGGAVKIGRWLPGLAAAGEDVVLLRGLVMGTTSHDAGSTYMDTAILSNNGRVNAASIPAIIASESQATIPVIQLAGGTQPLLDRGLLKPLSVVRAQNLDLYRSMYPTEDALVSQRVQLLDYLKSSVTRLEGAVGSNERLTALTSAEIKIRGQIVDKVGSQLSLSAEDLAPFSSGTNNMGGRGGADAFALALKLLKNDLVTCVNMGVGGFDTHAAQSRLLEPILTNFDRNLSVFISQLKASGNLDNTLIVLFSDFGRTPKVNGSNGRDHWPVGGAVMIGGGIAGGRAVGATDDAMRAINIDPTTGAAAASYTENLNATHLGGSVLKLALGSGYMSRRPYLKAIDALTRLKS